MLSFKRYLQTQGALSEQENSQVAASHEDIMEDIVLRVLEPVVQNLVSQSH
jgi:hypothetical protein